VDNENTIDQHDRSGSAAAAFSGNGRAAGQQAVLRGASSSSNADSTGIPVQQQQQRTPSSTSGARGTPGTPSSTEYAGAEQDARVKLIDVQQLQQEHLLEQQEQHSSSSRSLHGANSSGQAGPQQQLLQSAPSGHTRRSSAAESEAALSSLIWHPSDSAVKPIVANRRIERLAEPAWDAAALPFAPLTLQHMLECDQVELERFLTQVYRTIASSAAVKQKVNLLAYFESLCSETAAANVLINSSLTVLFVRMLRNGKMPLLRIRLASVLGLLIRHATFIADELASTQLVQILTEALSDSNERVRRRCVPVHTW